MKIYKKLNLAPLMNHRLVYEELPGADEEFGLDNICILQENFKYKAQEKINGAEFKIETGNYDNMVSERQRLEVNDSADRLHILGFGYWGDAQENLKIVYGDGEKQDVGIALLDWSHGKIEDSFAKGFFEKYELLPAGAMLSTGRLIHAIYFHHCISEVESGKTIREIIFPDNMFMHIFAVTLEQERSDT